MGFCASASAAFLGGAIAHGHVPAFKKPLLTSEGELWRHQRRIMAGAFHNKRIAGFIALIHSPLDQSSQGKVCRLRKRLGVAVYREGERAERGEVTLSETAAAHETLTLVGATVPVLRAPSGAWS
jgi:hypothetical protein